MRHTRIERWSRQNSFLHRVHPAAKILVALVFLVCVATLGRPTAPAFAVYLALFAGVIGLAGLPVWELATTAAVVMPFAVLFAIVSALAGDPQRSLLLVIKTYVSALITVLLIASSPMSDIFDGFELLLVPCLLTQIIQFIYRYFNVLIEEASSMRDAAASRGGRIRVLRFRQASAAAGVLFARSWGRAQAVHRAMIARGFEGHIPRFQKARMRTSDAAFIVLAAACAAAVRATLS